MKATRVINCVITMKNAYNGSFKMTLTRNDLLAEPLDDVYYEQ